METTEKPKRAQQVYMLVVEVGRKPGDGLPDTATGAALVCYASGVDEALGGKGFVTLLGSTGESPQRQQAVLSTLMEHTPTGFILSPAEGSDAEELRHVLGAHANVLLFNRELAGAGLQVQKQQCISD